MSLTYSNVRYDKSGSRKTAHFNLAFDSSYPWGGEADDVQHLAVIEHVDIDQINGYHIDYDYDNNKFMVFKKYPPIIYEELQTCVAKVCTLDYPAAWIINVCETGQGSKMRAVGSTLANNEWMLTAAIAPGVRTGLTSYAATDALIVTYITQAWLEVYNLLVQEEALTLATGANDLDFGMMAFGHCEDATDGFLIPVDVAASEADGEVGLTFNNATGALYCDSEQNGHTAKVTYLKAPAATSWLGLRFIPDEDAAKTGSDPYFNTFDNKILIWGTTGYLIGDTTASVQLIDRATTPATGEANAGWQNAPGSATLLAQSGANFVLKDNVTQAGNAYVRGSLADLAIRLAGLPLPQVPTGTDLSSDLATVRVKMHGY